MNSLGMLVIVFALAFLAESLVEYLFGTPLQKLGKGGLAWLLMYISAAVGMGLAFWYDLDLISLLGDVAGYPVQAGPVGYILTGLGIGRGANWLHQFVSQYFPAKK